MRDRVTTASGARGGISNCGISYSASLAYLLSRMGAKLGFSVSVTNFVVHRHCWTSLIVSGSDAKWCRWWTLQNAQLNCGRFWCNIAYELETQEDKLTYSVKLRNARVIQFWYRRAFDSSDCIGAVVETSASCVNNLCVVWYHDTKSVLTGQRRFITEFDKEILKENARV